MENKNYIVGVDLGSNSIVVAVGVQAPGGRIEIEEIAMHPSKGIVSGEVRNVEQAAQSIKEAVEQVENKLGIRIASVYAGISGVHIKCAKHPYYVYVADKDGEISDIDVRKLNESMSDVQVPDGFRLLDMIPQHYLVNNQEEVSDPVGMFGKTLGSVFNLTLGENTILQRQEKAFQKIDMKVAKLFANPLAAAEAVTFPDEKDLGVAVIDLGAGTTDICIYQDGIIRYIGVIPIGTDAINKDIRSYGIMERYVEELKVKYGSALASEAASDKLVKVPGRTPHDHKEISFHNLAAIIEARLNDITDYIFDEIRLSGYEGKLGAGIVLTGGGALTKQIQKMMEERTGLEVRIAAPDAFVTENSREEATDPRAAAVIGVLLLGSRSGVAVRTEKTVRRPAESQQDPFAQDEETTGRKKKARKEKEPKEKEEKKEKGPGIFDRLKRTFEKTFDFDVLDDDNDMV